MQEPDYVDIEVFVGVDIAKGDHYACVVTSAGAEVQAASWESISIRARASGAR